MLNTYRGLFIFTLTADQVGNKGKAQHHMAKLKARISKADHEKLDEALKDFYTADGDDFKLDSDHEDVTGLKTKNSELLEKVRRFKDFEGLDAADVKAKLAQLAEQESADLAAKGKWDELEKNLRAKQEAEVTALITKLNSIIADNARKDLRLELVKHGADEEYVADLETTLTQNHIKFAEQDGKAVWKTLDDTEVIDFSTYIPKLKESKAKFFKSDLGLGAGSSGSNNNGGNAKTMPHAQWKALSPPEQAAFIKSGGTPVQ